MNFDKKTYCGFINIVGKYNVGKSTLLNKIIGNKISITSYKKRTTCQNIIGVYTNNEYQAIYIDTPGFYIDKKSNFNHLKNNDINASIFNNTIITIFVTDCTNWNYSDDIILSKLKNSKQSIILAINKVDILKKKVTYCRIYIF